MKGTYRSLQKLDEPQERTNFDDWNDQWMLENDKHKKTLELLTQHEKSERLAKCKTKTAYCQTESDEEAIHIMIQNGEPLLSLKEVRLLQLPYYNGVILNLKDDGYQATAEYMKDIIVLDEMYNKHDPNRNVLRFSKPVLDKLEEGLKTAEDARKKGNHTREVEAVKDLALHFMNSYDSEFRWLAEELLEKCFDLLRSSGYDVHPQVEATVRYFYSSFLLDVDDPLDLELSKFELERSMQLSAGRHFWIIDKDDKKGNTLYLKSCVLLSKIYLRESSTQKRENIDEAIQSCRQSLKWAKQANDTRAIATVLLTLAELYMSANLLSLVLDILKEHIALCKRCKFYRDLCEGYSMLSKYHETVGHDDEVVDVLEELISFAQEQGILDVVTKAHLDLAEIYSIRGNAKIGKHAKAAFECCRLFGTTEYKDLAMCFVGIAQANPLLTEYANLVTNSATIHDDDLTSLIDWKALRLPFFKNKTILYHSEIEDNIILKEGFERVRAEELAFEHEQKELRLTLTPSKLRASFGGLHLETLRSSLHPHSPLLRLMSSSMFDRSMSMDPYQSFMRK